MSHRYLFKDLQSWWARVRGKEDPNSKIDGAQAKGAGLDNVSIDDRFWALQDINLEIKSGEALGIIGRNGAGKSTLLKILSRVTAPTQGAVKIRGRIGSLLEVGTGFHPELSGRENIFLNGAILGMRRNEIQKKFDEIVAFAEVEKFIDTPVKRYSSGMYVRLAFAVAAHLDPEILVVDEVLAVGDAQFQKKCLGKMGEVSKNEGRTVLFVSHNMTAIKSLCRQAVLLEAGMIKSWGETGDVVDEYLKSTMTLHEQIWESPENAPGNEKARLRLARIRINHSEMKQDAIKVDTPLIFEFEAWNYVENALLNYSLVISNNEGLIVFNDCSDAVSCPVGIFRGVCHVPGNYLNDIRYTVRILLVKDQSIGLIDMHDVLIFDVHDIERQGGWMANGLASCGLISIGTRKQPR